MMKKSLLGLSFFMLSLPLAAEVRVRSAIEVLPLRDIGFAGKTLQVSVLLPCDAKPRGVYIDSKSAPELMRLAYVIERTSVICAGMPKLHVETLRDISYLGKKSIIKIAQANLPRKLTVLYPDDITPAQVNSPAQALVPVVCGEVLGAMYSSATKIQKHGLLAFIGEEVKKEDRAACVFSYKQLPLNFLTAKAKVKALREDLIPEQTYDLRIRRISSLERSGANQTTFRYERACNEVPVAFLFQDKTSDVKRAAIEIPSQAKMSVGILTARFFNKRCDAKKLISDEYVLSGYSFNNRQLASFVGSKGIGAFRLKSPTAALSAQDHIAINYLSSCRTPVAMAIFPSQEQRAAVAVLEPSQMNTSCNVAPKEVSLKGSLSTTTAQDMKLYPLQLTGSAYF